MYMQPGGERIKGVLVVIASLLGVCAFLLGVLVWQSMKPSPAWPGLYSPQQYTPQIGTDFHAHDSP